MDYLHYNPVKHGYVTAFAQRPYSAFHRSSCEDGNRGAFLESAVHKFEPRGQGK